MRAFLFLVFVTMLVAALASAAPPRVANDYAPAPPVELLTPPVLWEVTDGDEETDEILGEIRDAAVDADGNTLLLDASFNTVRLYDPAGEPMGAVGRDGEGPGEFQNPGGCLALPDGRVGVTQVMPGQITTIERSGDPGESIRIPGSESMQLLLNAATAADGIVVCTSSMVMAGGTVTSVTRLRSLALDGTPRVVFKEQEKEMDVAGHGTAFSTGGSDDFVSFWAAGADGRVYVSPSYDEYSVEVYDPDGALRRVIDVDCEPVERTDEEIAAIEEHRSGINIGGGAIDLGDIEKTLRRVESLHPRADGTLWVASSRGSQDRPARAIGAFDVFDQDGKLRRRVAVAADYDPDYDQYVLDGDRLYVFKEVLGAPVGSPSGGDGAMILRMGPPRKVDPDREPMPYSVVCYDLSGL